ncbi:response regulator [Ramlibacter rhizophilus]|uniref:response regulator n=1 Tax=Ramlibacter rhizophilus TaxID=1781167 RepID=UPI001432708E|nr:response regulator [Ramlibacter rhizophilus]
MSSKRVLLVDDEISNTEVLGLVLAQEGYEVTLCGDGRQALAGLSAGMPDLLITDFMMPLLNGAELVQALRELPGGRDVPVVLMSGAPESALRTYGIHYEVFLRKPFSLSELLDTVHRLLDGPRLQPAGTR